MASRLYIAAVDALVTSLNSLYLLHMKHGNTPYRSLKDLMIYNLWYTNHKKISYDIQTKKFIILRPKFVCMNFFTIECRKVIKNKLVKNQFVWNWKTSYTPVLPILSLLPFERFINDWEDIYYFLPWKRVLWL